MRGYPAGMGMVSYLSDRLTNALTGSGTARDPRTHNSYVARIMTQHEIAAAYSGSGLLRKIISIPALDMVREWRTWTGADADEIAKLYEAEKRFGLVEKIKQAETLRAMGGAALILGLPGNPATPANPNAELAFVHVVSRWHLTFDRLNDNALDPMFGEPEMWQLTTAGGQQPIHPSRVIPFRADTTAALLMPSVSAQDQFWGESTVQQVLDAVQDSDLARQSFAALIHKARLTRIGIPDLLTISATEDGERQVMTRLSLLATAESIHNATIYDAGSAEDGKGGEKIDDAEYTFAGAKDVLNAYGEWAAAISDIPATRLLGRAPEGMNSSGDSQQADWNKRVRAQQTLTLAPCLDRLDPHLAAAASVKSAELSYDFDPLDTPNEKERAERWAKQMEALDKLQQSGAIPDEAFARGVQSLMIEEGYLPELEAALAEIPDDERYGIVKEVDPALEGDPTAALSTSNLGGSTLSGAGIQRLALNGAQIKSLLDLIQSVESGLIDVATAQAVIRVAFPTLTPDEVTGLLANAGDDPEGYLAKLGLAKRGSASLLAANDSIVRAVRVVCDMKGGDPASLGGGADDPESVDADPADIVTDAEPRPLYVSRKLLNGADLIKWAKANGFATTLPAEDMHVTILYSKRAVDPIKMGETWHGDEDGEIVIKPGGPRALEQFGEGAVVLQFASWELQSRHNQMVREGASHDYPEYLPHVTLTYEAPEGLDLATVLPYSGEMRFGPEIFAPLDEDWKAKIEEA